MGDRPRLLMCRPEHFSVEYVINPWMEGQIHKSSRETAAEQWARLHEVLGAHADIELIDPQEGLPDMVFTANAGLVARSKAVPARFFHPERRAEEAYFAQWFADHEFTVAELPRDVPFEGAGDAFIDADRACLWAAYGSRTELTAHPHLAELCDIEVVSLRLIDSRFYHLDTCFSLPGNGMVMYFPGAFDAESRHRIEARVPPEKRILVEEADAMQFACNAVTVGDRVVMNHAGKDLEAALRRAGLEAVETPLTEFIKAGGAAKCLTLELDPAVPAGTSASHSVTSREVAMEGHLLDQGLLERALDISVRAGGTFHVLQFDLGRQQQSHSRALLAISAPSREQLELIMPQL
ncbi:MAG: fused N-dimethylarginine dimethylaminohydrolase/saccharopine dehydrogenase domain-containing protein, partial [Akkermansiaceae bacterium]|nr:fused N-dimethylarginine dimethylaminohydrolase/saccharopine dehydrogenase domain-containing protein [Akkermansiaceae bacterium]